MVVMGTFMFSVISVVLSILIIRKFERFEKTELMTYLLLFVWGAFLLGIYVARPATGVQLVSYFR